MHPAINDTTILPPDPLQVVTEGLKEFSELLQEKDVSFTSSGPYLFVGSPRRGQGWILDISGSEDTMSTLVGQIIPLLIKESVPFRMVKNEEIGKSALMGHLGYSELGKLITLFPGTSEKALKLAKRLVDLTSGLKGPAIPTDCLLGGTVYARFGGYITKYLTEDQGNPGRYYLDENDQALPEEILVPFKLTENLKWPFADLTNYEGWKEETMIAGKYQVVELLKNDWKGRVMKTSCKTLLKNKLCLIKEGIANMATDPFGRDIQDKLKWQYSLAQDLVGVVSIPRPIDLVSSGNRLYFVMEWLDGRSIGTDIDLRHGSVHWECLDDQTKDVFTGHILFILDFVEKIHQKGYYHRDITSRNFLLTERGYYGIDLELAYNYRKNEPTPPFRLGSPGYMSPEQQRAERPTLSQEMYAIGALLLRIFTGLSPKIFNAEDSDLLYSQVCFLTGHRGLGSLITTCMSYYPDQRPPLARVSDFIKKAGKQHYPTVDEPITKGPAPTTGKVREIIEKGIACLAGSRLVGDEGIWFSRSKSGNQYVSNDVQETSYRLGMQSGLAGVLYFLSTALLAGYDISACRERNRKAWIYLDGQRFQGNPVVPGLYHGSAGAALAFSKTVAAGLIGEPESMKPVIEACLSGQTDDLTVANGLSGQGLALIGTEKFLGKDKTLALLEEVTTRILDAQQKTGAWSFEIPGFENPLVLSGFSHGTAGIIYFLLLHYELTKDQRIIKSAVAGLDFLEKALFRVIGKGVTWHMYPDGPTTPAWLENGAAGIVLPYIKAYTLTGNDRFKEIAESTLREIHQYLVTPYLSVQTGAAGIGEVYLQAWQAFGNEEWKHRADWIVKLLLHTYQSNTDQSVCWVTDNTTLPTADLLLGSTGILLFLMRWLYPEQVEFQIFN